VVASVLTRLGLGMCMEAVNSEVPGGLHGGCAGRLAMYKERMRQCTAPSLFPTASCQLAYVEWKALGCLARHPSINEGKALALAHIPLNFSRRYEYDAYGKIFLSTDSKHHTYSSSLIRGLHGRSYY